MTRHPHSATGHDAQPRRHHVLALVAALAVMATMVVGAPGPTASAQTRATSTPVMARSRVTAADLAGWFRSTGKTNKATAAMDTLAGYFITEGADEGVAGDLAFAQAIVETGNFGFSGRVPPSANNFAGIGATDSSTGYSTFPDAQTGVRAQIQHLRAYADPNVTEARLAHKLVDPRFDLIKPKGKASLWEQYGGGVWATDPYYAGKVLGIYGQILAFADKAPLADATWSPFATAEDLVAQGYRDLLFREATPGERSWSATPVRNGAVTPAAFYASLVEGEGQADAAPVARLYLAGLGRLPDRGGLVYWTSRHRSGTRIADMAKGFLNSSEFQRRFGAQGDAAFIDLMYRNVLGHAADPAGAGYWAGRLRNGLARHGLLVQFSESSEFVRTQRAQVEVSIVDLGMLGRAPDGASVWSWVDRRAHGAPLSDLTGEVFRSEPYHSRFT